MEVIYLQQLLIEDLKKKKKNNFFKIGNVTFLFFYHDFMKHANMQLNFKYDTIKASGQSTNQKWSLSCPHYKPQAYATWR